MAKKFNKAKFDKCITKGFSKEDAEEMATEGEDEGGGDDEAKKAFDEVMELVKAGGTVWSAADKAKAIADAEAVGGNKVMAQHVSHAVAMQNAVTTLAKGFSAAGELIKGFKDELTLVKAESADLKGLLVKALDPEAEGSFAKSFAAAVSKDETLMKAFTGGGGVKAPVAVTQAKSVSAADVTVVASPNDATVVDSGITTQEVLTKARAYRDSALPRLREKDPVAAQRGQDLVESVLELCIDGKPAADIIKAFPEAEVTLGLKKAS